MSEENIVEVDIDSPQHRNVHFFPLDRILTNRVDFHRRENANEIQRRAELGCPQVMPGKRVSVNIDAQRGEVIELMRRNKAAKKWHDDNKVKLSLDPLAEEVETFDDINPQEWLFWMQRLVDTGKALLVTGESPSVIHYKPPKNCLGPKPLPMNELVQKRFDTDPIFATNWVKLNQKEKEQVLAGSI